MTRSVMPVENRWYFDATSKLADWVETTTGAASVVADDGVRMNLTTNNEVRCVNFGVVAPYTVAQLHFIEFLFKIVSTQADNVFAIGLSNGRATADFDVHPVRSLAKITNQAVTLDNDDGVAEVSGHDPGHTVPLDQWIRARIDVRQAHLGVSAPGRSRGNQATWYMTAAPNNYQRHIVPSVALDLHDAANTAVSPFFAARRGTTGDLDVFIKEVCLVANSPHNAN